VNHLSVASIAPAPASQLIGPARKSRSSLRPEAVNRAMSSVAELFTQKAASAVLVHDARLEDSVVSLFDFSTEPEADAIFLGRSVHPGYIDIPFVTEEVLANGHHDFGSVVAVVDLSPAELQELEKTLDDYEQDVRKQIAALRAEIEQRAFALEVTGQLPLGIAA